VTPAVAVAGKPLSWSVTGVTPVPAFGVGSQITATSCPSTAFCVAVTDNGDVLTTTDPSRGSPSWSVDDVDGDVGLDGISCPSTGLCLAVDAEGNVLTTEDPANAGTAS
jgi:hypothetical protein